MDPKVYGKLLTHHRRGCGVDVEALHDRFPLRRSAKKAPRWDLTGTESCGGGNRVSWCSWMFSGYMSIYRRKSRSVEPRGAHEGGGAPSFLVAALLPLRLHLQVFWFAFGPRKIITKVSFRLDSVWYSFSAKL